MSRMVVYRHIWSHSVTYGSVWSHMVILGVPPEIVYGHVLPM